MNGRMRGLTVVLFVLNVFAALEGPPVWCAEPAARLPAGITLEQTCPDAGLTKVVLIAGSNFFKPGQHEYIGGCSVLMDLLRQTPGVAPVLAGLVMVGAICTNSISTPLRLMKRTSSLASAFAPKVFWARPGGISWRSPAAKPSAW